jgi:hypothetical protein
VKWYILWQLAVIVASGFIGVFVMVFLEMLIERIANHPRTTDQMSVSQLKREIDKVEEPDWRYELQRLLAESRMGSWWKFLTWLAISGVVYCLTFLLRSS